MKYILTCSCHNMDKKALATYSVMFPGAPTPPIIKGRDRIYKWAKEMTPPNDHIIAISKLSGKYAYYVELENGTIIKEYDLMKGGRIK